MKIKSKIIGLMLSGILSAGLVGCGSNEVQEESNNQQIEQTQSDNERAMEDVKYYQAIADSIGDILNIASTSPTTNSLERAYERLEGSYERLDNYKNDPQTEDAKLQLKMAITDSEKLLLNMIDEANGISVDNATNELYLDNLETHLNNFQEAIDSL